MLRILTILVTLILQRVLSEEVINTQSDYYQMATLINLSIGSPPAPLQLQVQFGTKSQNTFGQFIIDQSFVENSYQYAEMVKNYEFKNIYNIKKSSTALSKEPFQIEDPLYHDQISGNYVSDIISYNNIQSKYQFACVTNGDMQFFYYSGVIIFDRLGQNIFDQMYKSQSIKTSDYILTGEKKTVKIYDFSYTWNQINIIFDLDQSSDYYKYPSNPMISNSDHFEIMSYGIYMDNEDVTDKLKYKKVSLDQITNYNVIEDMISIPTDLLQLIQNKYNIPEELSFRGCAKCQCQDVVNLPEITIITEQYKFSINRSQYTQGNEYDQKNEEAILIDSQNFAHLIPFSEEFDANYYEIYYFQKSSILDFSFQRYQCQQWVKQSILILLVTRICHQQELFLNDFLISFDLQYN
ncbi:hypothetical protein ABPG73_017023 [Tetrahymena malaccensis]